MGQGHFLFFHSYLVASHSIVYLVEEKKKRKTILIFGANSFAGSNLAEFFVRDYRVIGTYYKNPFEIPGVLLVSCNVLRKEKVQSVLLAFRPDIAIYAVGPSSLMDTVEKERLVHNLNTTGLFNIVEYCHRYGAQIVYLSSVYVFGGEDKQYIEIDVPDMNTIYGEIKASAEYYLQKTSVNYLIFRCCSLYGRSLNPFRTTWFEMIQGGIANFENISSDHHVRMGFLDVFYAAMAMRVCFEKDIGGRLFHISSSDCLTHYEFAKLYCQVFRESDEQVIKSYWKFPLMHFKIPSSSHKNNRYHLDASYVENILGVKLPSIKESLELTRERFSGQNF